MPRLKENALDSVLRRVYIRVEDSQLKDWAGETPCCHKMVSCDLSRVASGMFWFYRKCPECSSLVEIACKSFKDGFRVALGIARESVLWGASMKERTKQETGFNKCISRGIQPTIQETMCFSDDAVAV